MAKHDTTNNTKSSYRYLHLTPEELAHLSPAELLQACLESRRLLHISIARHCYHQIGIFWILLLSRQRSDEGKMRNARKPGGKASEL